MAWVAKSNGQANRTDTTLPGKHLPVQDFVVRNINSLGLSSDGIATSQGKRLHTQYCRQHGTQSQLISHTFSAAGYNAK